uniref:Uncharacterized protein n=1 Tax=Sexangularia sp. CB-2014 TaxID=1486929 RepID=A0A7S1VH66_9EUKA
MEATTPVAIGGVVGGSSTTDASPSSSSSQEAHSDFTRAMWLPSRPAPTPSGAYTEAVRPGSPSRDVSSVPSMDSVNMLSFSATPVAEKEGVRRVSTSSARVSRGRRVTLVQGFVFVDRWRCHLRLVLRRGHLPSAWASRSKT